MVVNGLNQILLEDACVSNGAKPPKRRNQNLGTKRTYCNLANRRMQKNRDWPWKLALHRAITVSGPLIGLATHLSRNPNRLPVSLDSKALVLAPSFLVRRASN